MDVMQNAAGFVGAFSCLWKGEQPNLARYRDISGRQRARRAVCMSETSNFRPCKALHAAFRMLQALRLLKG